MPEDVRECVNGKREKNTKIVYNTQTRARSHTGWALELLKRISLPKIKSEEEVLKLWKEKGNGNLK